MAANGISTLGTKQLKQEGKLAIATAKRQGKVVARDGTVTGSTDATKNYYRAANTLDINLLPTKYTGNAITNNANGAVQIAGTGLLSASTSSKIVTGSGTSFTTLTVGTVMTSTYGNFGIGTIASIQSDTQLTLTSNSIVGHASVVWQYLSSSTLVAGRPWSTSNPDTAITVIETSSSGATLILNLDSRNTNSLARSASPGTWYDLTTNHNDATIYGSVAYGTVGGQNCAVFPGGDANYAQCVPNVYFDGNSFTIQSWVYVSAVLNWNRIIDFGRGAGSNNILLSNTYGGTGKPGIYIEGSQFQSTYPGSSTVLLNAWHQICATFTLNTEGNLSQGLAKIYIDGQPYGSGVTGKPINITRTLCYIGKSNWGNPPDPNMQGGIGAIQIYNGALTDAEMLSNYNTTKSYYGL